MNYQFQIEQTKFITQIRSISLQDFSKADGKHFESVEYRTEVISFIVNVQRLRQEIPEK